MNPIIFEPISDQELLFIDGGVSWNDVGLYIAGAAGGAIGAYAGARVGAAFGTACAPGVGTVIGTIVGGAAGVIIYSLWD